MRYMNEGAWVKNINPLRVSFSGSWVDVKQRYVKHQGLWKMLNPRNLIVMYYGAAPDGSIVCNADGATAYGAPNFDGKYPRGDGTPLQSSAGNMAHAGTVHGTGQLVGANHLYTASMADNGVGFADGAIDSAVSHSHAFVAHNHSVSATPTVDTVSLVPTIGDDVIRSNAIILAGTDITLSGLTNMTESWLYRYIKFSSAHGTSNGNMSSHDHGAATWNTAVTAADARSQKQPSKTTWHSRHYHASDSHSLGAANVSGPTSHKFSAHKVVATTFFSDLPSGSIMPFTSAAIPPGWTKKVYYFIRIWKSGCSSAEADSHIHGDTAYNLQTSIAYENVACGLNANKTGEYKIAPHSHPIVERHGSSSGNIMPYIRLVWAQKD